MCLRDMPTYSLLTPSNAGENRSRIGDHGGRKQQWARRCTGEKAAASRRRVRTPRLHPAMRMWSRCCSVYRAGPRARTPPHQRTARAQTRSAHPAAVLARAPCFCYKSVGQPRPSIPFTWQRRRRARLHCTAGGCAPVPRARAVCRNRKDYARRKVEGRGRGTVGTINAGSWVTGSWRSSCILPGREPMHILSGAFRPGQLSAAPAAGLGASDPVTGRLTPSPTKSSSHGGNSMVCMSDCIYAAGLRCAVRRKHSLWRQVQ
jgi:hypothetical protein